MTFWLCIDYLLTDTKRPLHSEEGSGLEAILNQQVNLKCLIRRRSERQHSNGTGS